jgi:hypothetical protein
MKIRVNARSKNEILKALAKAKAIDKAIDKGIDKAINGGFTYR